MTELAQNISDSIEAGDPKEEVNEAIELITSKAVTRDVSEVQTNGAEEEDKVFMVSTVSIKLLDVCSISASPRRG